MDIAAEKLRAASQEVRIPPNPAVDARAAEQDFYRRIFFALLLADALKWLLGTVGAL